MRLTRTHVYLFPMIALYPKTTFAAIQRARPITSYVKSDINDTFGLHIVVQNDVEDPYIIDRYFHFKSKKRVIVLEIIEKLIPTYEAFIKGEYSKMYENPYFVPKKVGKDINLAYQVLTNTELSRRLLKEKLIELQLLDDNGDDWLPTEGDFKPDLTNETLM